MASRMMEEAKKQVRRRISSSTPEHSEDTQPSSERGRKLSKRRGRRSRSFDPSAMLSKGSSVTTNDISSDTTAAAAAAATSPDEVHDTTDDNTKLEEYQDDNGDLEDAQQQPIANKNFSNVFSSISDEAKKTVRRFSIGSSATNFEDQTTAGTTTTSNTNEVTASPENGSSSQRGRRSFRKKAPRRSRSFDNSIFARVGNKLSSTTAQDGIDNSHRSESLRHTHSVDSEQDKTTSTTTTTFSLKDAKDKAMRVFGDAKRRVSKHPSQMQRVASDSSISLHLDDSDSESGQIFAMGEEEKIDQGPKTDIVIDATSKKAEEDLHTSLKVKQVEATAESGTAVPFLQLDTSQPKQPTKRLSRRTTSTSGEGKQNSKMKKKSWRELLAKSPSIRVDTPMSAEKADPPEQGQSAFTTEPSMAVVEESEEPVQFPKQLTPETRLSVNPIKRPLKAGERSPTKSPSLRSRQRMGLITSSSPRKSSGDHPRRSAGEKSGDFSSMRSSDGVVQDMTRSSSSTHRPTRTREVLLQKKEKERHPRVSVGRRRRSKSSEKARLQSTGSSTSDPLDPANNVEGNNKASDQDLMARRGRRSKSKEKSSMVLQPDASVLKSPQRQRNTRLSRRSQVVPRTRPRSRDRASDVLLKAGEKLPRSPRKNVESAKRRTSERNDKRRSRSFDKAPGHSTRANGDKLSQSEHVLGQVGGELPGFLKAGQRPKRSTSRDRISQSEHNTGSKSNIVLSQTDGPVTSGLSKPMRVRNTSVASAGSLRIRRAPRKSRSAEKFLQRVDGQNNQRRHSRERISKGSGEASETMPAAAHFNLPGHQMNRISRPRSRSADKTLHRPASGERVTTKGATEIDDHTGENAGERRSGGSRRRSRSADRIEQRSHSRERIELIFGQTDHKRPARADLKKNEK